MTVQDLVAVALPVARSALARAKPAAHEAVGGIGWLAFGPAWALVTGPMLPFLVRVAVELAVGLLGPQLLPIFELVLSMLALAPADPARGAARWPFLEELVALLRTPRTELMEPVRATIEGPQARDRAEGP